MKPFLGIDLTTDKRNTRFNGEEFIVQKPSDALASSFADSHKKAEEIIEKANMPFLFHIIKDICGLAVAVIAIGILKSDVSLEQAYKNAPDLFWAAGICAVIWVVILILGRHKAKTVLGTDESYQTFEYREGMAAAIYNELSVPDDAKEADILSFFYKLKNGTINPVDKGINATYYNYVFRVFKDDKNLYLANLNEKYAFPLSSVGDIRTIEKRICISGWNKEVPFNEDPYKQYKITRDDMDYIHCKPYYVIEINHNDEEFGIYIPGYELPVFEELLNKKAE